MGPSGVAPSPSRLAAEMPPAPERARKDGAADIERPCVGTPGRARTVSKRNPFPNFAGAPLRSRFLEYDCMAKQIDVTGCSAVELPHKGPAVNRIVMAKQRIVPWRPAPY